MITKIISKHLKLLRKELLNGSSNDLEEFASKILSAATGLSVRKAASGSQSGADAGTSTATRSIRVETKRYKEGTSLRERELLGEVAQAFQKDNLLEVWILAATREVPEQTVMALRKFSEEHGTPILIIDWSGELPLLALLCAACPNIVNDIYGSKAATASKAIMKQLDENQAFENLKIELEQWSAGWAFTKELCNKSIVETLTIQTESKALFRQNLSVANTDSCVVKREDISEQLNNWRSVNTLGSPLFIIGKEGRGKSWALADWIYEQLDNNDIVLFCSSSEFRNLHEYTVDVVLSHALSNRTGSLDKQYWLNRLKRFKDAPPNENQNIWLIIDGLNENPSADWHGLFLDAQRDVWLPRVKVIASCRTRYFEEQLNRGISWFKKPTVIEIPLFTSEQRDQTLNLHGVNAKELSESVLTLAKTPRICHLVAQISDQLKGAENITYERLLFEYGKRFNTDSKAALSDQVWHTFLQELAKASEVGLKSAKKNHIREWIDIHDSEIVEAALSDIIDGNLIRSSKYEFGKFEFDRKLVLIANGLALWKLIESKQIINQSEIADLLATELEPLGGIDERPPIILAALTASILSETPNDIIRPVIAALLVEGITSQNLKDEEEHSLLSYVKTIPYSYLDALKTLAFSHHHDEASFICWALRRANTSPQVEDAVISVATDWIRIVSLGIKGEADKPEKEHFRSKELIRLLGYIPSEGELEILGVPIIFDSGDIHHKLPIYALRLIQPLSLSIEPKFWQRYSTSSLFDHWNTMNSYAHWVVKLNQNDFEATTKVLRNEADKIKLQHPPKHGDKSLMNRAAAKLLFITGIETYAEYAQEILPPNNNLKFIEEENKSFLTSGFQLRRCHVEEVLNKSKQHVSHLSSRASSWWPDPNIAIPSDFINNLINHSKNFTLIDIKTGFGHTRNEFDMEGLYISLARCSPSNFVQLLQRQLCELKNRTGESWARLATSLIDLWLVSTEGDRKIAYNELQRNDIGDCDEYLLQSARNVLYFIASNKDKPEEYPSYLLSDKIEYSVGSSNSNYFGDLSYDSAENLTAEVSKINKDYADWIYVNQLAYSNTPISDTAAQKLITFTQSKQAGLRRLSLYTLAHSYKGSVLNEFNKSNWSWKATKDDTERRDGSYILLENKPFLPLNELVARIVPWLLPAVGYKYSSKNEIVLIAKTVTELLSTQQPPRHPFLEKNNLCTDKFTTAFNLYQLEEPDNNNFHQDFESHMKEMHKSKREAIKLISNTREVLPFHNVWIEEKYLDHMLKESPDELIQWLADISTDGKTLLMQIRNSTGFYYSLCNYLLKKKPDIGVKLWKLINQNKTSIKFTGIANIDLLFLMPFKAPPDKAVNNLIDELWDLPYTSNDQALFNIVIAAESTDRHEWLNEKIRLDVESDRPWRHDRALYASAFRLNPKFDYNILNRDFKINTHREIVEYSTSIIAAQALWQRYWLEKYFTEYSSENALAALFLFIEIADSRWPLIIQDIEKSKTTLDHHRMRYFRMKHNEIDKVVKKTNDRLKGNFLGESVSNELWPWFPD